MTVSGTKHYKLATVAPKVSLTADDEAMFMALYRHGIVDTHSFRRLLPHRSPERVGKRLRDFTDTGHVVRHPEYEGIRRPGGGSYAIAYGLGNKGAQHLKEKFGLSVRTTRRKAQAKKASSTFILHGLENTRFMIDLRMSAGERDSLEFHYADQVYRRTKPELLEKKQLPKTFTTKVDWYGWRETEGTQWDGFCSLEYKDAPPDKRYRYLFVELDRSTETVASRLPKNLKGRAFFKGNSYLRKLVVYGQGFKNRDHTRLLGIPTFQVLNVTTTPGHAGKLRQAYVDHLADQVAPVRFLFTDLETIEAHNRDIISVPLIDGAGKVRTLA